MFARILCTTAALLLSVPGFFENPTRGDPLNPSGILFLLLAGVVWLGWDTIRDAYAYREEIRRNSGGSSLLTARVGPVSVRRLVRRTGE